MDRITPVRRPRGRADTKAHHRKPSHTVAVRAFASNGSAGKALMEYAAELIKRGEIATEEDLQRHVDSGAFGRWLDSRRRPIKVDSVIVGDFANPNRTYSPEDLKVAPNTNGADWKRQMAELKASQEEQALKRDVEMALAWCLQNRSPEKFAERLAIITRDRLAVEAVKAWKRKRK